MSYFKNLSKNAYNKLSHDLFEIVKIRPTF